MVSDVWRTRACPVTVLLDHPRCSYCRRADRTHRQFHLTVLPPIGELWGSSSLPARRCSDEHPPLRAGVMPVPLRGTFRSFRERSGSSRPISTSRANTGQTICFRADNVSESRSRRPTWPFCFVSTLAKHPCRTIGRMCTFSGIASRCTWRKVASTVWMSWIGSGTWPTPRRRSTCTYPRGGDRRTLSGCSLRGRSHEPTSRFSS